MDIGRTENMQDILLSSEAETDVTSQQVTSVKLD